MEIILATRNRSKIDQIKAIFVGLDVEVLSLADVGVEGEAVEDGLTLEENAFKKALFANEKTGKWVVADDTGLFIDAMGGRPGIHAARWAGDGLKTEEVMRYTLDQLKNVPFKERMATFKTVAVVVSPEGKKKFFEGSISGIILTEPRMKCQPDMPYSAIFLPDGYDKVWAEMTVEEENFISHRGQAFRQARDFFGQVINSV